MSNNLFFIELENHRSRERIKNIGEVFTPEKYVQQMLECLDQKIWSDEKVVFFEPSCGHGNIVIPIYKRRLESLYKKASSSNQGDKDFEAPYYAVANALNTLWAIDIDSKNIENCRSRVLLVTLDFLKNKLEIKSDLKLIAKKRKFFAHVLSAIKWHIGENETLSALSGRANAKAQSNLTKAGSKWFSQNDHHQMNFDFSWVHFFESCEANDTVPIEYERSLRFIDSIISGKFRGFDDFEFAKVIVQAAKQQEAVRKPSVALLAGA